MVSEETPPLSDATNNEHELLYQRFSPIHKKFIVAIASWCGLMPFFISGTFYPSVPEIAKDLHTTGQTIGFAVSLSVLAISLGSLCAATYSTFYGRRPVYLSALPYSILGSVGVATAQNMPQLLFWRFWQCAGASPGLAVGAGVIGDIYKLEERGTAMGFFLAAVLLGSALAPPVGGFVTHYASWRTMQLCLGISNFIAFGIIFLTFPETSQPGTRGIDKLRQSGHTPSRWVPVYINPLRPLNLIRSPNLSGVLITGFFVLLTDYVLLIPFAYTIGKRYHLNNAALVGACFLPSGLGNMVGAFVAGWISDKIVVRWKEKRGGVWYPEDRLRGTLLSGFLLVPLSVLACGLITHYVEGRLGLILNLASLFINGLGVDLVLAPSSAYSVDIMHSRSAEVMAFNNGFRAFLLSFAMAGILPMINKYGFIATSALSAILAWIGAVVLLITVRYGEKMRGWVDVGYSTARGT